MTLKHVSTSSYAYLDLTWEAVANASLYKIDYKTRLAGSETWSDHSATTTETRIRIMSGDGIWNYDVLADLYAMQNSDTVLKHIKAARLGSVPPTATPTATPLPADQQSPLLELFLDTPFGLR